MRLSLPIALLATVALTSVRAPAQRAPVDSLRDDRDFSFYSRGPYRPGVPRPDSLLGYGVGEWHTQFAWQERTLLAIARAAPERVRVEEIATTQEGRRMRLYIVSSPANLARLDAIRGDLDKLADPRGATAATDLDALAGRVPVVVWFSGSVHGDEVPGFEASMQLLYQLAASEEPATVAALEKAIVIINPSTNPDGHERFAVWYNSIAAGSPEPMSIEQQRNQPWSIRGRYNHYRFDMNRDVMATTQREVQGLVRGMLRWHPMVAADLHGYTTQYFFAPAAKPVNANIGEQSTEWLNLIGKGNAAAFDKYGWGYYVRDVFDLYYPGYWDTWPSLNGAIGMTYETDGGPAFLKRRDDGTLLSLRDGIAKHFVAAMATVETSAGGAQARVRGYLTFRRAAVADGRAGTFRRVVLVPGDDPGRAAELATALVRSGIEVQRSSGGWTAARAHDYASEGTSSHRFDAGAYVVDMAQPQGKLAHAFLEPRPDLDPDFAKAQTERYRRNIRRGKREQGEGYEFYDITAWSLPVAFGVEAFWTEDAAPVGGDLLVSPANDLVPDAIPSRTLRGERLAVEVSGGIVTGKGSGVAYVFSPMRSGAPRLAYHLLREGYRVAVASQPIEAGGRTWPRGSYVIRVGRNDATLHERLDQLAKESGVEVTGIGSGFPDKAQFGIGSEATMSLTAPRIAILADEGVSNTAYGAIWWSFEQRYGIRFTPIAYGTLTGGDLTTFNVIIVPDASGGMLDARLGKDGAERLKGWVRNGGTLITMGGATAWAARESVGLTTARGVGIGGDKDTAGVKDTSAVKAKAKTTEDATPDKALEALTPYASPSASNSAPQPLPGSHFDVVLDRTHWLTYGYEQPRLTVMLDGDNFLKLSKEGTNVAVFPSTGKLSRAGFTWPENTERLLRGTAFLVEEPLGDGHVVLFTNDPMFRGWWRALDRLVLNAVLLGTTF